MVPNSIVAYLREHGISFTRHWHPRAVEAQRLAQAVHMSGSQVAKSIIVDIDGKPAICVVPAPMRLDAAKLAEEVGARRVRMMSEDDFSDFFEDCEVGAEPPFGGLYGLPVMLDDSFRIGQRILFRAGSHEETIEMKLEDFVELEHPIVAPMSMLPAPRPPSPQPTAGAGVSV